MKSFIYCFAVLFFSTAPLAVAQQGAGSSSSKPPSADVPQQPSSGGAQAEAGQTQSEQQIQKKEQSQRILGVVPQFGVTSRQNAPPLTSGQKFHLFTKSALDPFEFAAVGFQAGLGQATNEFPGYGQGAEGYGKRYGASFADQVSSGFFSNFFYPVLLKEDPRYFRSGEGSIKHRIGYSLAQEFVCRTDKGKRDFNWSNVLGAFTSGTVSNAYYPSTDRGVGLTVSRSSIALLYGAVGGLVDEFWPDIQRKVLHKHSQQLGGDK